MRGEWFKDHWRQVHMDFHMPEWPDDAIDSFDAKAFVAHLARGKVNMVALFAKCHFGNSFYNTKVGHKHSGLPNDFLMEAAEECRKQGIRTIAYYSFCWDKHAWDDNPDWRWVNAEGETFGAERPWGILCMNTPYREELCLPQIEEIARDYPVDGFFLDIPYAPEPCFCKFCKKKFKAIYDIELAPNVPDELLQRFKVGTCASWLREIRGICDRHNPDLILLPNGLGHLRHSREVLLLQDVACWESQPKHGDYLTHSYSSRQVRTLPRPAQVMTVRFYQGWGDLTLKPAPQLTSEFAVMLANGMESNSGDQVNVNGTLQPPVYDLFAESFGFVEAREKTLKDAKTVPHTAVLLPEPDAGLPMAYYAPEDWAAWRGAHKTLVESHVQFDLLLSGDVDKLADYEVVILPEPCAYTDHVLEQLRMWAASGGTLIAVGGSLVKRGDIALKNVLGVELVDPSPFSLSHFKLYPEVRGETAGLPLQLRGASYKVAPSTAEVLADLHYPMAEYQPPVKAFRSPHSPAQPTPSGYPFITVNAFVEGRGVYVAGSLFEVYWRTNHHWLRQTMDALYRHLVPEPPFRVDAAPNVEANLMRSGGDMLLNLVQYQLGHQGGQTAIAAIERVDPIHDIKCSVKAPANAAVILEPEGEEIPCSCKNGYVGFTVPSLKYMAIARVTRKRAKKKAR